MATHLNEPPPLAYDVQGLIKASGWGRSKIQDDIAAGRLNLISAGERGCTPIDHPGPRWSHYVFKLRGGGIGIETIDERHGGPYAGSHARYVLRTPVTVIERSAA